MAKRGAQQRTMPVLAVVRKPPTDPHVCSMCPHGHGAPGTRCERHGKYIERLPTEEERTPEDREREANRDPKVALDKIMALVGVDEDSIEFLGEDPVVEVQTLIKLRDDLYSVVDESGLSLEELVAHVRVTFEERNAAFSAIDEYLGSEPSDKDDVEKIVEQFANESTPRDDFDELLRLLNMTRHDWACEAGRYGVMSSGDFLLMRLRAVLPEILQQPVTVIEPPGKRKP